MSADSQDEVWCIVVAAGSGSRFGGAKQHAELDGATLLERVVATAREVCDGVVVCVAPGDDLLHSTAPPEGVDVVVEGGDTRASSVRNGMAVVPERAGVILVHDAARPLASTGLFRRVISAIRAGADAAVPVVPVVDTVRAVGGGTVDREGLRAVQTPQGFRADVLRAAHSRGGEATDDASLVEAVGAAVVLVDGERSNLKITEPVDLDIAAALLARDGRIHR